MTREEIKLIKEQQDQIEKGYKYQIKRLEEDIRNLKEELSTVSDREKSLTEQNRALIEQIQHMQSGLTGEEKDYYL